MRSRIIGGIAAIVVAAWASACFGAADFKILDFEGAGKYEAMPETKVTLVAEHATEGAHALKMECSGKEWPGIVVTGFPKDWTGVKYLAVDVFNPGTKPVELCGWFKDDPAGGFYSRMNYRGAMAEPGQHTVRIWLSNATKGNAFPLNKKNIVAFCVGPMEQQGALTLYVDNLRLEPETGVTLPDVLPILDFEENSKAGKWEMEDWPEDAPGKSKAELTAEHATDGKRALKFTFRPAGGGNLQAFGFTPDWSQHDFLVFDVFNPQDEVIELSGWFKDSIPSSYYNRYNYTGIMIKPGANQVRMPLMGLLRGESAGSGPVREALNRTNILRFNLGTSGGKKEMTLYFNNFRLEKSRLEKFEGPRVRKFDFGPNIALAFPGFTPVNNYSAYEATYGYGLKGKLASDPQCGSYEYPNDLFSDFVPLHEFAVDLPNGRYHVMLWAESANYWEPMDAYRDRKVWAEEKLAVDDRWTGDRYFKERFFRHAHDEDLPGDDHWDKYVKPRWTPFTFDVDVTDGQLNLRFDDPKQFDQYPSNGWPLNAVIICPAEDAPKLDAWLAKLETEEKRLFALSYVCLPSPAAAQKEEDLRTRSFPQAPWTLFVPDYFKDVYYDSVPTAAETGVKEIKLVATPGEYAPAAVGVYPTVDLGKTTVTVSELKSVDGKPLGAGAVTAHKVRYKIMRRETGLRYVYSIIPRMVDPEDWADVKKGVTRTFHVIAKVPKDAAPGVYSGTVTITPVAGVAKTLPISLTVLPFTLAEDRDFDLCFFSTGTDFTSGYPDKAALSEPNLLLNLRNLREHGMTSTTGPGYASYYGGNVDAKNIEHFVKLYHEAGFDGNMFVAYGSGQIFGANSREQIVDAYTKLCKRLAELGRTKLMLSLADEPAKNADAGVHENYLQTIERLKLYKDIPGLMTSGYYSDIPELIPWFEVSILGQHDAAAIKRVIDGGKKCWTYGTSTTRMGFGFYAAKLKSAGVGGTVAWHYQAAQGDVYNSLDGREEDHCMAWPLEDGVINAVAFDRVREGVYDFRYLTTLRALLDDPKWRRREVTKEWTDAKNLVDEILSNVTLGVQTKFNNTAPGAATFAKCAEYRGRIIAAILSLK